MASSWELTQQAFAVLQDALRDSEARAEALDSELKRKRSPRNQLEQQVEVLQHRLANLETECERWRVEAGQLEEVAENERAKVTQLRKKLDIAESGPERLTKKEINFWRAKADAFNTEINDYRTRIAALMQELKDRDAALARSGAREAADQERERELAALQAERARLETELDTHNRALAELTAGQASAGEQYQSLERELAALRDTLATSRQECATLETSKTALQHEFAALREAATLAEAARQQAETDRVRLSGEIARLEQSLGSSSDARISQQAEAERLRETLAEREHRIAALTAELEGLRAANEKERAAAGDLRERAQQAEQRAAQAAERLASLEEQSKDTARSQAAAHEALSLELRQAREYIGGLEAELKEEKECIENLSEVANERRELITRLEEQLEEAQERHAEAAWRLSKAQHFERLVHKRRKLIGALIQAIRNRHKANTALKAGLDSLRTYKAAAEQNQQKLLKRIDKLTRQLHETEETLKAQQSFAASRAESAQATSDDRQADLEQRLNAQNELIESLESELKSVKASRRVHDDRDGLTEELRAEIDRKNEIIRKLETDADEQQRKIAKLRGSESETLRLRAESAETHGHMAALEQQVAELKALLAHRGDSDQGSHEATDDLQSRLTERELSIAKLVDTIKEHESRIAELNEAVRGWRQKYEFLATEEPAAYRKTAEK